MTEAPVKVEVLAQSLVVQKTPGRPTHVDGFCLVFPPWRQSYPPAGHHVAAPVYLGMYLWALWLLGAALATWALRSVALAPLEGPADPCMQHGSDPFESTVPVLGHARC